VKEKQVFYEIIHKRKRKQAPSFVELSQKVQLRKKKNLCKLRVQQKWSSSNGEQKKVELIILLKSGRKNRKVLRNLQHSTDLLITQHRKKQGK